LACNEFLYLLDHEQGGSGLGIAACASDEFGVTLCLCLKNGSLTFCFCIVGGKGCIRLTSRNSALALGFCFGCNLDLLFRNLFTSDFLSTQALTLEFILSLFNLNLRFALGDF